MEACVHMIIICIYRILIILPLDGDVYKFNCNWIINVEALQEIIFLGITHLNYGFYFKFCIKSYKKKYFHREKIQINNLVP